jgi:scyllo-inositol 2-dehydrogenase (NADP+)
LTLSRLLDEGALGQVHRFESRFERWRPQVKADSWRERPDPAEAGGLLYDLGSHLIDQSLHWFGPVLSVYAEQRMVRPGAHVDDDVFVALRHASGVQSHLWASAVAADLGPRLRVLGSVASYVKSGLDPHEDALRRGESPRAPDWGVEPEQAWGRLGTLGDYSTVATMPGAYQDFYRGVRDSLRYGTAPPVSLADGIHVIQVVQAAQRSARDHVTVTL